MKHARTLFLLLVVFASLPCAEKFDVGTTPHDFDLGEIILRVPKPNGWFASTVGDKDVTAFKVTKEKHEDGSFLTGLTINLALDVKNKTNAAPSVYAKKYLADVYKAAGEKALEFFPDVKENDIFRKIGVRVNETKDLQGKDMVFTVNHSVFYNDEIDILMIVIFGAPKDKWDENNKYFLATSQISLVKK